MQIQAISIPNKRQAALIQIDDLPPKNHEVKLRIDYVGLCGTDLSTFLGKNPLMTYPRIPGHEISGTIVALGDEVPLHRGYDLGRSVTVIPYSHCGSCAACLRGRFHACTYNQTLGVKCDGAMQEFFNIPFEKVLFADGLSAPHLALVEPLTVGFHAVARGRVAPSDTVLILGCGMIGMGAIIGASLRGAKVIAVDLDERKLALAKSFGAAFGLQPGRMTFRKKYWNSPRAWDQMSSWRPWGAPKPIGLPSKRSPTPARWSASEMPCMTLTSRLTWWSKRKWTSWDLAMQAPTTFRP
ncbi:MAG: hypothetical protein D6722_11145 [Bacteroidetes bacterium]|nr:MAG: hypothetical protein D6722_11145 [Bacteroidota bacterium]